jgi:Arc/MetJ-type ribon-helix-helix transcriptional regulator
MSELMREALRRYMSEKDRWDTLRTELRDHGEKLGIRSEADVERMSDELRRERGEKRDKQKK